MTASLGVIIPTRGRRAQCERLLESYDKTTEFAELMFVTDPDDKKTYEGMNWKDAMHATLDPRGSLVQKLNETAHNIAGQYDALMFVGDDHVFETEGWDAILMRKLEENGGTGFLYPDDKRRNDVPEICLISSDIVQLLGHFADPSLNHYYIDNVWSELGRRSSLLRFVPEVVIEHKHYSVDKSARRDKTYSYAEKTWGQSDYLAYQFWRQATMPMQVSQLRRAFNPDIKWLYTQF